MDVLVFECKECLVTHLRASETVAGMATPSATTVEAVKANTENRAKVSILMQVMINADWFG